MSAIIPNPTSEEAVRVGHVIVGVTSTLFVISISALIVRLVASYRRDRSIGWDGVAVIFGMVSWRKAMILPDATS
jgi:hypothetical protein